MTLELLSILRCPEDRSPLALIDDEVLAKLNRAVESGTLRNRAGRTVEEALDGGLVREAGDLVYPIRQQIPVLLKDDAIPLNQLSSPPPPSAEEGLGEGASSRWE